MSLYYVNTLYALGIQIAMTKTKAYIWMGETNSEHHTHKHTCNAK